ncbi:hypothetical protein CC79DRAFT_1356954 [Sarocladium strictum]
MIGASTRILAGRLSGTTRSFHVSARRMADAVPLPAKRPMGAFRGGLFGFLFGCVASGGAVYSYLVQEYKTSNDLLTEDIYALRQSVNGLTNYVQALEQKSKK